MPVLSLPPDVEAVLQKFLTGEVTTVNKQGQPLTWPNLPYYDKENGRIIVTSSVAFPTKALIARRNPKMAVLYSDPTGSGLADPPAVLVQGDATVSDMLGPEWESLSIAILKESFRRQPESRVYLRNPVIRKLFEFYYQRLVVVVQPRRILAWPHRDMAQPPTEIEVRYVE
jgi:hypothetical protein